MIGRRRPLPPSALASWLLARPATSRLPHGPRVVALDGRSGAGKTTLALETAAAVTAGGGTIEVVHLDDLYPGWDGLADVVPLVVEHLLTPLSGPAQVAVPTWDWGRDHPGPSRPLPGLGPPRPALVLLEGAGAGARAAAPWLSGVVWVDAAPQVRRSRALARDGDLYAPHWQRWSMQEAAYVARELLPARADLVLDTTGDVPVAVG